MVTVPYLLLGSVGLLFYWSYRQGSRREAIAPKSDIFTEAAHP